MLICFSGTYFSFKQNLCQCKLYAIFIQILARRALKENTSRNKNKYRDIPSYKIMISYKQVLKYKIYFDVNKC